MNYIVIMLIIGLLVPVKEVEVEDFSESDDSKPFDVIAKYLIIRGIQRLEKDLIHYKNQGMKLLAPSLYLLSKNVTNFFLYTHPLLHKLQFSFREAEEVTGIDVKECKEFLKKQMVSLIVDFNENMRGTLNAARKLLDEKVKELTKALRGLKYNIQYHWEEDVKLCKDYSTCSVIQEYVQVMYNLLPRHYDYINEAVHDMKRAFAHIFKNPYNMQIQKRILIPVTECLSKHGFS